MELLIDKMSLVFGEAEVKLRNNLHELTIIMPRECWEKKNHFVSYRILVWIVTLITTAILDIRQSEPDENPGDRKRGSPLG